MIGNLMHNLGLKTNILICLDGLVTISDRKEKSMLLRFARCF